MRYLIFVLFFLGCSIKTTPVYVTFKSPKLKISDQGFLKEGYGYKEFDLYKAGASYKITLKNSYVCLNEKCMDKKIFVKEYLGEDYPSNFLEKVINKEPVESFGKIIKTKNGFIQKNSRFFYKVDKKSVLFKDKKKKIIVFIKELG
jgi:hypothetical protein